MMIIEIRIQSNRLDSLICFMLFILINTQIKRVFIVGHYKTSHFMWLFKCIYMYAIIN